MSANNMSIRYFRGGQSATSEYTGRLGITALHKCKPTRLVPTNEDAMERAEAFRKARDAAWANRDPRWAEAEPDATGKLPYVINTREPTEG
ncbi:hypothetical protein [Brumicola nitratireducens]|uniref:hypothetical protein n=1 Tax=Brumicola nitratireducens TaxID=300231 RepID=UPI00059E853F|nr:hypothetical protein [Glaciecola nitratireducens]